VKVTSKSRVLNREWMEFLELENLLDIGEAMAASSLQRPETRGAHYRTDFPALDANWTANLIVRRHAGQLQVEKKAVVTLEKATPAREKIARSLRSSECAEQRIGRLGEIDHAPRRERHTHAPSQRVVGNAFDQVRLRVNYFHAAVLPRMPGHGATSCMNLAHVFRVWLRVVWQPLSDVATA